eukprot:Blabericola_migrator_1__1577@NODE_141_length_13107_cov_85_385736_g123_i0_p5_GENE_NODE_141_length_13107_cov_85_385736_g123_i0NODE_141_length_13107_cov_85_385736_g123_i0_p5_ORF_typecomplete_len245_score24_42RCC1/PF00415_18/3e12RCC1/PF00415_18/58RCC1/PF00415_18/0_0016RCC1/PF00415_18/0_00016RCC1_2/PF13540_6/0_12RCC1_2/PF13540_6/1_9e06RCC1_2/PF13540_6/0_0026RCC1_2/PF13540_6/0_0051RCC1_2/PF13540_6/7e03_NODE_141_length_13107_cov_85_385736_g123_i080418775
MAVVLADGSIMTWGAGSYGRLGTGSTQNIFEPTPVSIGVHPADRSSSPQIVSPPNVVFSTVSCGDRHTVALSTQGAVYIWGSAECVAAITDLTVPTSFELQLQQPDGVPKIQAIHVGFRTSAALTNIGRVIMWGSNSRSQVGGHLVGAKPLTVGDPSEKYIAPIMIPGVEGVEHIGLGTDHTVASTRRGDVFGWGSTERGKLGIGQFSKKKMSEPTQVSVTWSLGGSFTLPTVRDKMTAGVRRG